jgi:hypothetical protein
LIIIIVNVTAVTAVTKAYSPVFVNYCSEQGEKSENICLVMSNFGFTKKDIIKASSNLCIVVGNSPFFSTKYQYK